MFFTANFSLTGFCQDENSQPDIQKKDFFKGEITIDKQPMLNQQVLITFRVKPNDNYNNLIVRISFDNGIKLISGIKHQDFIGRKDVESSFQYVLKIDSIGMHQIKLVVYNSQKPGISNMYFLSFLTYSDSGKIIRKTNELLEFEHSRNRNLYQIPSSLEMENYNENFPLIIHKNQIKYEQQINMEAPTSTVYISGRLRYEDLTSGSLLPVRYATVRIFKYGIISDTEIGTGYTDNTGNFNIPISCTGTIDICVKIYNECSVAKCLNSEILGSTYETRFPTTSGYYYNINCSSSAYTIGTGWYMSDIYPSWQAVDNCVTESQWIADRTSNWTRSQVTIVYPTGSWPHSHGNSIHLCDLSTYNWDNITMFHEYAHCVMYTIYGNTWPGGCSPDPHSIMTVSCEGFALTEGWAEFLSGAVINDPNSVVDWVSCANLSPNNMETNLWWKGTACNNTNGAIVEGSVGSIWWDIFDSPSGDDDGLQLGFNNSNGSIWHIILDHKPYGINSFWDYWMNHFLYGQQLWSIYFTNSINKDNTAPNNPTSISSSSHTLSSWSSDRTIDINWSGATDNLSGVKDYSWEFSSSSTTIPDQTYDGSGTSATSSSLADGNSWYFHIRTRDNALNWNSAAAHKGPYFIDGTAPNNPTSISSSSHSVSTWNTDNTIDISWSGASDGT